MYFYSSLSGDAPKLNNTWGDFNKLINYLIDGGAEYSILKIEPYEKGKVKIYYDDTITTAPWSTNTTIVVNGSLYYNKNFFIESIDSVNKFCIAYNSTVDFDVNLLDESLTIKGRTIASGITRKFGGVSDMRTVIKFTDGIEYRIDDRDWSLISNPVVSFGTNWVKTARVCMAESFDNLDFTSKRMFPYNGDRPSENFTPIGRYIGQGVIAYNIISENVAYLHQASYGMGANAWRAWASENFIIIQMYTYGYNSSYSKNVMFGSFNQIDKSLVNGILQTNRLNGQWDYTGGWCYSYNRNAAPTLFTLIDDRNVQWSVIYSNYTNTNTVNVVFYGSYSIGYYPPSASGSKVPYPMNGMDKLYFSDVVVTDGTTVFGTMYDIKWVNSNYLIDRDYILDINNEKYMALRSYSTDQNSCVLVRLDIE